MKALLKGRWLLKSLDIAISPLVLLSSLLLLNVRRSGIENMSLSKMIFRKVGVFPIREHYYEPLFDTARLKRSLSQDRFLPGIDFNVGAQLDLLKRFDFNTELTGFPLEKESDTGFHYHNPNFGAGDAEYLYSIIRLFKPKKIIEIGCGNSTIMASNAVKKNASEDPLYNCSRICIEPYEMNWLESAGVEVMRKKAEDVDRRVFSGLGRHDILFIDSSHVIRPQGDVLFEYLEILPSLKPGVLVHIHDIFTPKDYPERWVKDCVMLWNEQYLIEAFLTFNKEYVILGALNFLKHNYFAELSAKCPVLKNDPGREPGSLWLMKK